MKHKNIIAEQMWNLDNDIITAKCLRYVHLKNNDASGIKYSNILVSKLLNKRANLINMK